MIVFTIRFFPVYKSHILFFFLSEAWLIENVLFKYNW